MNYTVDKILNIKTGQLYMTDELLSQGEQKRFKLRRQLEENIQNNDDEYVCAVCKQKLKIRAGLERMHHFAHVKDSGFCPIIFWLVLDFINNNTEYIKYVRSQDHKGSFTTYVSKYRAAKNIEKEDKYTRFLACFFPEIKEEIIP
ncbi:hypothetical protein AGMMS49928_23260 [Spirochaetia bacterium]|nr:hypothetical protein AGMMS49928_23260 [Spirochaetia bacterium]